MNAAHLTLRRGRAVLVLALAVLVAGCSAAASPAAPTPAGAASPAAASSAPAGRPSDLPLQTPPPVTVPAIASPAAASSAPAGRPSDLPLRTPLLATVPPSAQPVVGEAPPKLVAAARADLAGRVAAGVAAGAEVVRAEEVVWPDGSLGCRVPGELYHPLETPGYWIVLRAAGREYDYRSAGSGAPRLCDQEIKVNPGG